MISVSWQAQTPKHEPAHVPFGIGEVCWCMPKVEPNECGGWNIIHRSWWHRMPPWGEV